MAKPKVGVILAGCGNRDGAEIHEAVFTMLALDKAGCDMVLMAPDIPQAAVVDHRTGEAEKGSRNVLSEANRIGRGKVVDIRSVDADALTALVLPGGFGAAKNLCTFADKGPDCAVNPDVERVLRAVHAAGKPIGAICIAPALLARVFGSEHPTLTIGSDAGTAAAIEKCGAKHEVCRIGGVVVDEKLRFVTTPAYMLAPSLKELAADAEKLVAEVLRLAKKPAAA
ncbi:MAG: isoprenoid biosynthesis glyoxalase ElbB [Elusimicrobia bacterium]|nr:isoprenoid biosynthesis glyoxalase ElbB [Elusimicrobiota bacterium]